MKNISVFIIILFVAATFFAAWQFYKASHKSKFVLLGICIWLLIYAITSSIGFYQQTNTFPPRFLFVLTPALILIILVFVTKRGRTFIDSLQIRDFMLLHVVRVPVEITLYFMVVANLIPVLMTFDGYNYDIISGITAPIIYYAAFIAKKISKTGLLIWNFVCLGLLINIVTIAILSAQTPFQMLAFDQPNIGVTYFPFVWLPSFIVPVVLFAHLVSIRQLINSSLKN